MAPLARSDSWIKAMFNPERARNSRAKTSDFARLVFHKLTGIRAATLGTGLPNLRKREDGEGSQNKRAGRAVALADRYPFPVEGAGHWWPTKSTPDRRTTLRN